jgi:transketolase N-terminal domain/subunit
MSGDLKDFQKISAWLEDLKENNPGTHTDFQVDADGHFECAFYSVGAVAECVVKVCIRCVQFDACHMKAHRYNGTAFVMEGKTGTNQDLPLGIGLAPQVCRPTTTYYSLLLPTTTYVYSLPTTTYYYLLLPTTTYYYLLLPTTS